MLPRDYGKISPARKALLEDESTKVVVARMKNKRRGIRLRVIAGCAVLAALIIYMLVDENHRQQSLQVQGPQNAASAHAGADPNVPFNNPNVAAPPPPQAGSVRVHVTVPKSQKQLYVDGDPIKIDSNMTLDLAPGKHLLMVQTVERTLIQKMNINANEAQKVVFTDTSVTIAPAK
jgi:hypothetical protein